LGLSIKAADWGLEKTGLDMTILAVGTCMLVASAAQTSWASPRFLWLITELGQRSYEVYLTHMFVVFLLFDLFISAGKPFHAIPALFIVTILTSGFLGDLVARIYSEPMNRLLRRDWREGRNPLGTAINRG
jgi:peptidoglycan/LPS O-acetylase OafA/YrhL